MTRKRDDKHSTEFGLWLRNQIEIDSRIGYVTSNVDYVWMDYRNGLYMIIEEKRYRRGWIEKWQKDVYKTLHRNCVNDPLYRGFHKLVFEKTSPDDGWVNLDDERIPREMLFKWLRFEAPFEMYQTNSIEPYTTITTSPAGVSYVTRTPAVPVLARTVTQ